MPEQRYEAGRQTVGALLSTTSPRIEVPEWQRSYAWDTAQVEIFWQDLLAFSAQYPDDNIVGEEYFLGSIVLVTGGATNILLDGQQRLATATILLSVLRDARSDHVRDSATRLQNKYISEFDDQSNSTSYVITLNTYDREFFRGEVQDEPSKPPARPTPSLKSHGLIRKARLYFEARVAEHYEGLGGGEPAFLWNLRVGRVLCDHMSLVAVTSSDEDNAAAVFETLNDRGIGLSTPDLLRNLLLRRAGDGLARERIVAAWQTVLSMNDDVSVDEFLRHYWVSHRGDVKARKLYREIKGRIIEENISPLQFSIDLAESAPVYRDIAGARETDGELQRSLAALQAMGAKSVYPMLLAGYAVTGTDGDKGALLRELAHALVTLFVRYNVIGGRETTVLESTVYEAAAQLRRDGDFDSAVASLAALSPDGADFVARFRRASVSRIKTARYLLREIEHAKRSTGEVSVEAPDRVHVEHIYPRTPEGEKWPHHSAVINRLGNLTLLGARYNTGIRNADFATKKEEAYKKSDILMTQELLALDTWDADEVAERQAELSDWVFGIWHFPGEDPPAEPPELAPDLPSVISAEENPDELPEVPSG